MMQMRKKLIGEGGNCGEIGDLHSLLRQISEPTASNGSTAGRTALLDGQQAKIPRYAFVDGRLVEIVDLPGTVVAPVQSANVGVGNLFGNGIEQQQQQQQLVQLILNGLGGAINNSSGSSGFSGQQTNVSSSGLGLAGFLGGLIGGANNFGGNLGFLGGNSNSVCFGQNGGLIGSGRNLGDVLAALQTLQNGQNNFRQG